MRFAGQLAIITGSSNGLGSATAKKLAEEGACVLLNDRDAARLSAAARTIAKLGASPLVVCGDATQPKIIRQMLAQAQRHFGKMDSLVNNAGGSAGNQPFAQITSRDWDSHPHRNIGSALSAQNFSRLCRQFLPEA